MKKRVLIFNILALSSMLSFGQWTQVGDDIDGEAASDWSGHSVSLNSNGNVVAIGAPFNDGNSSDSGHVRVYENVGDTWIQIGNDIDGEAFLDQSGYSINISADGNTVAIGAIGTDSGYVRVYNNVGGTWTQIGDDIDGEAANDQSGWSVSLSTDGSTVAIGARLNDSNGTDAGHVRVYENVGGTWTQVGDDIDGEAAFDQLGNSVSLSADGNMVAIGAPRNDDNGNNSGHVRVYENAGGTWTQVGDDIDGKAAEDFLGISVNLSADGNTVAIGATGNDSGHVRVHKNVGGVWTQVGDDIDGEATEDFSGTSVSLSADGSIIAIGAPRNDGNGTSSGHVRVYENVGGTWTQVGLDIDGETTFDDSGTSVSLSADGSTVAIGATFNDGSGSSSGHVRIYHNPSTLSSSHNKIEGLTYSVVNGSLVTNQANVTVDITDILGKSITNQNLQGIYIVTFKDSKGATQTNKLFIK